jgi:hypothetical protein
VGVGVVDGIVSLEQSHDFAMGAPPGAPGSIGGSSNLRGRGETQLLLKRPTSFHALQL